MLYLFQRTLVKKVTSLYFYYYGSAHMKTVLATQSSAPCPPPKKKLQSSQSSDRQRLLNPNLTGVITSELYGKFCHNFMMQ